MIGGEVEWLAYLADVDLVGVCRALQGQKILGVRYVAAEGSLWPSGHSVQTIHEVDVAIWLSLENDTTLVVAWEMDGLTEGLSLSLHSTSVLNSADSVEASGLPDWQQNLGGIISEVGVSWQVANEGCPRTLWALRISLSGREQVAFALGEVRDGSLSYQPDGLVTLFGTEVTESYRIPASQENAVGKTVRC